MDEVRDNGQPLPSPGYTIRMFGPTRRTAGLFLCLTAVATVVSVFARVAAGADQHTLAESLAAISENQVFYFLGGAARTVSGVMLLSAGWRLSGAAPDSSQQAGQVMPLMLAASGILTAVSGISAMTLTVVAPGLAGPGVIDGPIQGLADLRWFTGKAGFTAAGLGLIAAALPQWKSGGVFRVIAPVSLVIGTAMLFIWIDAATAVHRITGPAFLAWIVVMAVWLIARRTESRDESPEEASGARLPA